MIRVGIDATAIPSYRTGAGNYIYFLVKALAKVDQENQYIVFTKQQYIQEWNIQQPNVCFICGGGSSQYLRLLWEQTVLPMLIKKHQIDVLHSPHYSIPVFSPTRSVVTFCDMTFYLHPGMHVASKRLFFNLMMQFSARYSDSIITISQNTANDLCNLFRVAPGKVQPIALAVNELFRPCDNQDRIREICQAYRLSAGEYILFVGMLEPRKNIPMLIRAYGELVRRGLQKHLAIVGKRGWMFKQIFDTVQELGLGDRVIFTGYVSEEDLPYLYNGACVFVYPSLYEGFGLPVLEAMSCGTPVITSNVSSMPEIVGDAGLLVNPHDQASLAETIQNLLSDRNLQIMLRDRGLQRATFYSWEITAKATIQVYNTTARV